MSCKSEWSRNEDGSLILLLQLTGDEASAWGLLSKELEYEISLRKETEKERDHYRKALEDANDRCATAVRVLPYDEGCQSIDREIRPKIIKGLEYTKNNNCDGCAYNSDNIVLRANCVGCLGFDDRPHKVPIQINPPPHWFTYKK